MTAPAAPWYEVACAASVAVKELPPAFWREVDHADAMTIAQAKHAAAAMLPERRALVADVIAEGRRLFPVLDGHALADVLPLPCRREALGLLLEDT